MGEKQNIDDVTEVMVQSVRNGDKLVAEKIILLHLPMAKKIIRTMRRRNLRSKATGIESAGMYGLVLAVARAPNKLYNNIITPYIASIIRSEIRSFLEHDHLVQIPRDEFRKLIIEHEGEIDFVPLYHSASPAYVDDIGEYHREDCSSMFKFSTKEHYEAMETAAILQEIGVTDREKEVVLLRLRNYTMQEIANQLGTTAPTVYNCLVRIQKKWRFCPCVQ